MAGPEGVIVKDGEVSPDGFIVNNLDPPYPPQRLKTVAKQAFTQPTIGDRLDAKGVSWRWYAGGWSAGKDAVAAGLMPHHNPFQYVKRVMETAEGREHLRDTTEFPAALRDGTLPAVAFVKPPAPIVTPDIITGAPG